MVSFHNGSNEILIEVVKCHWILVLRRESKKKYLRDQNSWNKYLKQLLKIKRCLLACLIYQKETN